MTQPIRSLSKALDLIDDLARNGPGAGVSEFSRRLGLTKNQVYRILKTLESYEYVHQRDDKTYVLGVKFFEVGQSVLQQNELVQVAIPLMDDLRNASGESVHLFVRNGAHAVCVAKCDSTAAIRMSARVGARFLLHAGACPKAILAYQAPGFVEDIVARYKLLAYTEQTLTDRDALVEHLAMIRDKGYAESEEDVDPLAYAIAVPIIDHQDEVNAAMSIAGPTQRFGPPQRARALVLLAHACDRVSAALGAPTLPGLRITCDEPLHESATTMKDIESHVDGLSHVTSAVRLTSNRPV